MTKEESNWISARDRMPPLWKYVKVRAITYRWETFVAKKTLGGYWKYKSGMVGDVISQFDYWMPLPKPSKELND